MISVFIDTNVLMDFLFRREPFYPDVEVILAMVEEKEIIAYTDALSLANCNYFLTKEISPAAAKKKLQQLRRILRICEMTESSADLSILSDARWSDFEDALHYFSAKSSGVETIITRNKKDFQGSELPLYTPEEFLKRR